MTRTAFRLGLFSLIALAVTAPALAYNLVNADAMTLGCIFNPTPCSAPVTDNVAYFSVPGGTGQGRLQSRIFQTWDGRWVYQYRVNMTYVGGITYVPWADQFAIANVGTLRRYDFNVDGVATDEVYNITSGSIGSQPVSSAFLSGSWSYFNIISRVYGGFSPGGGESSYFFGLVSDRAPVLRTVWVHLDTGWVSMQGYAPSL
jgi:hypothetical protein